MPFEIKFGPAAQQDLRVLRKYDQTAIRDQIQRHLLQQPTRQTGTGIKELVQPAISRFRLRVGEFRVYYDVDLKSQEVHVIRVVEKGRRTTQEVTRHEDD